VDSVRVCRWIGPLAGTSALLHSAQPVRRALWTDPMAPLPAWLTTAESLRAEPGDRPAHIPRWHGCGAPRRAACRRAATGGFAYGYWVCRCGSYVTEVGGHDEAQPILALGLALLSRPETPDRGA
jgi:hypothetical protein